MFRGWGIKERPEKEGHFMDNSKLYKQSPIVPKLSTEAYNLLQLREKRRNLQIQESFIKKHTTN